MITYHTYIKNVPFCKEKFYATFILLKSVFISNPIKLMFFALDKGIKEENKSLFLKSLH